MSLQGKIAIITGAGKGIGRATALTLAKQGVSLGLIARTEADLQAVAEEVSTHGVGVEIATADITDNAQIEQKSGDIINISSTAGEKDGAAMSAYSASKFGVMGLTESLAMEARKHDIRVTALTPSTVVTDLAINEGLVKGDEENMLQPEDVADLVLASLQLNRRVFMKSAGVWTTNP